MRVKRVYVAMCSSLYFLGWFDKVHTDRAQQLPDKPCG